MIIVAIVVAILYPFVIKHMEKNDIQLLNETTDTNIAIEIRKKLKRNRIIMLILMLILYAIFEVVTTIVITNFEDPQSVGNLIQNIGFIGVAMYTYLKIQNGAIKAVGNISTSSKHDFLEQHNEYCLFLRGFEQDDYGHDPVVSEKTYDSFSEYEFTSLVIQNIPICAVGMTKEVNSPRGATRVYLNDDSWQKDVLELMEKSQAIYILVNDRKSCIWEIEQSFKMLGKTVYIIDDIQKYENVRQQLAHIISLPKIPNLQKSDKIIFVMTYLNNDFDIKSYKNNIEGYSLLLGTESEEIKKKKKTKKVARGCLITSVSLMILIPFIYILCALMKDDSKDAFKSESQNMAEYDTIEYDTAGYDTAGYDMCVYPKDVYETPIDIIIAQEKRNCITQDLSSYTLVLIDVRKQKPYIEYIYYLNEEQISIEAFSKLTNSLREMLLNNMQQSIKQTLKNNNYGIKNIYVSSKSKTSTIIVVEPHEISD